ncbi:MAG: NINE protein [Haloechinothrix sp.]
MAHYLPAPLPSSLLQILIPMGIGRFYTGHTGIGIAQLLVAILTCGIGSIWLFIDEILVNGGTDSFGRPLSN